MLFGAVISTVQFARGKGTHCFSTAYSALAIREPMNGPTQYCACEVSACRATSGTKRTHHPVCPVREARHDRGAEGARGVDRAAGVEDREQLAHEERQADADLKV